MCWIGEGANKFLNEHGIIPIVQEGEIEEVLLQSSVLYQYFTMDLPMLQLP
ncbi:hypothetical protein KHA80_07110 [Anaerobacillus sp. HL2]|nr:hypothetical protein KHA80_07110 [Anaerobacillus sp. HL2]